MRLAFITPRYGAEISSGAEHACRLLAERVAERHDVDVITTCASEPGTWRNEYSEGTDRVRGVVVRRFSVTRPHDHDAFRQSTARLLSGPHTRADEMEWVNLHGPCAPGLVDYLKRQARQYDALVFFSLQHATTVHGLAVAPERSVLFPHLQCRPSLRLGLWQDLVASVRGLGLLSFAEKALLDAYLPGCSAYDEMVGVGIEPAQQLTYPRHQQDPDDALAPDDDVPAGPEAEEQDDYLAGRGIPFRRRHRLYGPLAVYAGRVTPDNGTEELLEYFSAYSEQDPEATLVLMGVKLLRVPDNPRIRQAGVLPSRDRTAAFEAADVTLAPASDDLLALPLLESLAVGTPVLASRRNTSAVEICRQAGGGLYYGSSAEFSECLRTLLTNARLRERMGESGRQWVRQQLRWEAVAGRFERLIGRVKRTQN